MKTFDVNMSASDSNKACSEIIENLIGMGGNVSGRGLDEGFAWALEHMTKHGDCTLVGRLYEGYRQIHLDTQAKQIKHIAFELFGVKLSYSNDSKALKSPASIDKEQKNKYTNDERKDAIRQIKDESIGLVKLYKEMTKKEKTTVSPEQAYNDYRADIVKKLDKIRGLTVVTAYDPEINAKICRSLATLRDEVDTLHKSFDIIRKNLAASLARAEQEEQDAAA